MTMCLLCLVILLVLFGLVFLYSTSAYNGRVKFHDAGYYFKKQVFATSLGLMGMYLVSCMDYHLLVKLAPFFYLISLLLSLQFYCLGMNTMAPGVGCPWGLCLFSPRSLPKVAVILLLTFVIIKGKEQKQGMLQMAGTIALLLPIVGLVGTNNLSTAIIILGIGVILIFVSNPRYLPFVGIGVGGILFIVFF